MRHLSIGSSHMECTLVLCGTRQAHARAEGAPQSSSI